MRSERLHMLLLILITSACDARQRTVPATQALVFLRGDLGPELQRVDVSVRDVLGARVLSSRSFEGTKLSFGIAPSAGSTSGECMVTAEAVASDGTSLVTSSIRVGFVAGQTLQYELWLRNGCRNLACDDAETCLFVNNQPLCGPISRATPISMADRGGLDATPGVEPSLLESDPARGAPAALGGLGSNAQSGGAAALWLSDDLGSANRVCDVKHRCAIGHFTP
jgi:hypothetical protein